MKIKVLFPLISLLFTQIQLLSQGTSERIFVQTDREYYVPGETVSFNAFVLADIDSVSSRNLFVELWDDSLHQLASLTVPLVEGVGSGSISIPRESTAALYFLRAYSEITAKQAQPYQFVKELMRSSRDWPDPLFEAPVFYPEGGSLVNHARNQVVFKAGKDFRGSVRNSKGETVATLNPEFNGMGRFNLTPVKGETYTCYWEGGGRTGSTPLPEAFDIGIALHIRQSPDTLFIDLDNGGSPDPMAHQLKMQLMIGNEPAYVVEMNLSKQSRFSYFIPLQDYRAGMAELRVLATDKTILASRPLFINRHSLAGQPLAEMQKKELSPRGENRVKLQFADTTIRMLSVSITDADYSVPNRGSGLAAALLSPDGQPVPDAFRSIHTPEQMDLAVLVAFSQKPVPDINPTTTFLPQAHYLQLEGTVLKGKKPLAEKNLLVGIRSASNGKELYKVTTDDNGKFVIDDLVLFGDVYVHCRIPGNEQQELTCTYRLTIPASNQTAGMFAAFEQLVRKTAAAYSARGVRSSSSLTDAADTMAYAEKSITLSEVVLTASSSAQATKRLKALEEKYIVGSVVSGYYATSETIDVLNDPGQMRYLDLFSYMRANLKRVDVRFVNGARQLIYFGRGGTGEMMVDQFYVDNSLVDRNQLDFIPLDQIAAIKFVQNLSIQKELPPALAIFLKKPGDQGYWEKDRFQVLEQKLTGYPLSPEFKEPDYRKEETKVEKDLRKTISWKPNTPLEKGVAEIQFYNNDRAKKIRIIAEGITADGSIIYVEKEIE